MVNVTKAPSFLRSYWAASTQKGSTSSSPARGRAAVAAADGLEEHQQAVPVAQASTPGEAQDRSR